MKAVHKVIYTCEEASVKILQNQEKKLSLVQRLRIWMHLQMCAACKRFNIQNTWIDEQLHSLAHEKHDIKLNESQKNSLKKVLEDGHSK